MAPFLDGLVAQYHRPSEIKQDPLGFPRRFADPGDQEVVALLAAALAWGRVQQIAAVLERLLARLGEHPAAALRAADARECRRLARGIIHRISTSADLAAALFAVGSALRTHGTLEALFLSRINESTNQPITLLSRLTHFADTLQRLSGRDTRGVKHLFPRPELGSACKRWMLFLRWVVRPGDGVDLGLWRGVSPAELIIPLDTHIHRIALNLRLTRRRDASLRTACEVTGALRLMRPDDPVIYDFALARLGIHQVCPSRVDPAVCRGCGLRSVCRHGLDEV